MKVIDTDIHPILTRDSIVKHANEPWRTFMKKGHLTVASPYSNPNGFVDRPDAITEEGDFIAGDAENLIAHYLDAYGVDIGILNYADLAFSLLPDADYGAAIASAINDLIAKEWLPKSPRLRASIVISSSDPIKAAEEIRRMSNYNGFVQVLMSSGSRMLYGQRFFDPIYEAACEVGIPVAIHPGSEGRATYPPTPAGYPSTYFEWHTDLIISFIGHVVSLITEGTFVKFPDLKFVLIEGGVSWLVPLMWRLDKNWKGLRISTPWLTSEPSKMAFEHLYLTTQPIEEPPKREHLHNILSMFPSESMLMFSSDYPHWDGDTPNFTGNNIPKSMRENVMYLNASKLYKFH